MAIVTGGSRGLGLEIAEGLAEAGARLMLCARREAWLTPTLAELRAAGVTVEGMVCDVSAPRAGPGRRRSDHRGRTARSTSWSITPA